jgi:23S rRNA (cytidine1920-2'-O)/16S rRNA (cytidine1409-2'-O)-methyltransferase
MAKIRLDVYLTENGFAPSRSAAQAMIMAGDVYINNQKALKAGETVAGTENIEVRGKTAKYVSRGGLKLEKAMQVFPINLDGKVCMDIGASTGGFTDCMLQNGATKVYAIDVGYGQLAWKLRQDERVVNMERTNIRYLDTDSLDPVPEFFSVDVSFISLKLVLPVAYSAIKNDGFAVCLIKPQFEAGRDKVGKKGVVREKSTHIEVIENTLAFTKEIGFSVQGLDFSPVRGPEGNIEYLMYIQKSDIPSKEFDVPALVELSHSQAI